MRQLLRADPATSPKLKCSRQDLVKGYLLSITDLSPGIHCARLPAGHRYLSATTAVLELLKTKWVYESNQDHYAKQTSIRAHTSHAQFDTVCWA